MSSFQSTVAAHDSRDVSAVAASLESTSISAPNDANIANNSTATSTATDFESPIHCHSFRFVSGECAVRGHFIKLEKSVFLVLGDEAGGMADAFLDNLVMGMHTRFDSMPLTTQLLASSEAGVEVGNTIAARLAKKYQIQAFVTCNIDVSKYEGELDPDDEVGGPSLIHGILENLFKVLGPYYS